MRSILLPVTDEDGLDSRLEVALDIGRCLDGHIQFLHSSPIGEYIAADPFGGAYYAATQRQAVEEENNRKHALVREKMAGEDVPWDFLAAHGAIEYALVEHSRLADLLVFSAPPDWGDENGTASELAYLAVESQCPVFAVPRGSSTLDCTGKAVIAWNGSAPAARAMRMAVPLLRQAGAVELLTIGEDPAPFPAARAAAYLSRQGISSEVVIEERGSKTANRMHELLEERGAAYLVMGAFSHSRLREAVFGGVSRYFIENAPVPVLMAH